ncbi:MAG: GAF domain-containing protein [Bacteroidetes bacterium]|nr:MAG: GAF domain-containing protein [Bacteroidota bacterium]
MKNFFYGIGGKIKQGYLAVLVLFLIISIIIFYQSFQNRGDDLLVSKKYFPMITKLVQLKHALENSERLIFNWANQPNKADKAKLINILETEYPNIKDNIADISITGETTKEERNILNIIEKINVLLPHYKAVMAKLNEDEDYSSDENIDAANEEIILNISPEIKFITEKIADAIVTQQTIIDAALEQKQKRFTAQIIILIASIILFILISVYATFYTSSSIVKPLNNLKNIIQSMSIGEIREVSLKDTKDEVGEMVSATKTMLKGMRSNTNFALEIGKGNYESDYSPLGSADELGNSLVEMRTNLKTNAIKDHQRNWATSGLAQMGEILRANQQEASVLYRNIIKFIVRYLEVNQGGLFTINEDNPKDPFIEMMSCYAYDKEKKNVFKRLELNDSILGECIRDLDTIMLTEIPDQYVEITSGLGHRTPSCILLVPLKINDEAYGAIELASFVEIERYKIEFIEKIAESIASTLSTVKTNLRTQNLLQELQLQGEYLRAQEEEMRQNLEELNTTQELMRSQEQEMLAKMQEITIQNENLLDKESLLLTEIESLKNNQL